MGGGREEGADVGRSLSALREVGREEDIGKSFGEEAWQDWAFQNSPKFCWSPETLV